MGVSDTYRVYANDCLALAEASQDGQARVVLLTMAQAWTRLADRAERRRGQPQERPPSLLGRGAPGGIDLAAVVFPKGARRQ
jgi:hypothetical protein